MAVITDTILAGIPAAPVGGSRQIKISLQRLANKETLVFETIYTYADGASISITDSVPSTAKAVPAANTMLTNWTQWYIAKIVYTIAILN